VIEGERVNTLMVAGRPWRNDGEPVWPDIPPNDGTVNVCRNCGSEMFATTTQMVDRFGAHLCPATGRWHHLTDESPDFATIEGWRANV
jgi:hypothetical protein